MTAFLLSVHVLAAILAIGPVAVAASMFPSAARAAENAPSKVPAVLHRITRVYAVIGILVPVFGLATAASLGVLGDAWLITSMILTVIAAAILIALVIPGQRDVLARLEQKNRSEGDGTENGGTGNDLADDAAISARAGKLGMQAGIFNLVWAIVVVLMIVRPGSTTGAGL